MTAVAIKRHQHLCEAAREHLLMQFTMHASAMNDPDLLIIERGEGSHVIDSRGRRYLDALSGLFCVHLGYSYGQEMSAAAESQLTKLPFYTNWSAAHPASIELAETLASVMPGDLNHAFFTSGGSESVESMWKIVREYFIAIGQPERRKVIARDHAYHGISAGALALGGLPDITEDFYEHGAIDVTHVSNTCAFRRPEQDDEAALCSQLLSEVRRAIEAAGRDAVAMILAEPVQNAGGCLVAPSGYWRGLRDLADECGALLVSDEVICGLGRLGEWLGIEREGVDVDLATLAKGLAGGYAPIGAVMVSDRVAQALFKPGTLLRHGLTFGGHPLSAAIASQTIHVMQRDRMLENVRELEPYLAGRLEELRHLKIVGDIRGRGFFWAIELTPDREGARGSGNPVPRCTDADREWLLANVPGRLVESGILARVDFRADPVIQIAPTLVTTREELDTIVDAIGTVLTEAEPRFMQLSSSKTSH